MLVLIVRSSGVAKSTRAVLIGDILKIFTVVDFVGG
jgi:hypothetical protein